MINPFKIFADILMSLSVAINPAPIVKTSDISSKVKSVYSIVDSMPVSYFKTPIDRKLVKAMITQESNFNPFAEKSEGGIKSSLSLYNSGDKSLGLMQILTSTATDLFNQGYRIFGKPTIEKLKDPRQNIYFGMAYIDYLQNRAKRNKKIYTISDICEWYNGGYGNSNAQTKLHAKRVLNYYNVL